MNECYIDKKNNVIVISEWYRGSFSSVRREYLSPEHKESFYNCLKRLGERPENYGYYKSCPICERLLNRSK
jgi:hypothetical protein